MSTEFNRKIVVGVCETQPLVVEGLRKVLADSGLYRLLEPTWTLEAATSQLLTAPPQIMFMDKALGAPPIIDLLTRIRHRSPSAVVIWGSTLAESEALRFLNAGAKGIIRKTAPVENILACLDGVLKGTTWMEEALFREHVRHDRTSPSDLTVRERQVLELVEQGLRNREIGQRLGIRPGTVKIHLKHIFEKTGIRGRYGLALSGLKTRAFMELTRTDLPLAG